MSSVQRLCRIAMVCRDPDRLADFYRAAFGFRRTAASSMTEPAFATLVGIAGARARVVVLQLGEQSIELVAVAPAGRPYPRDVSGRSLRFQHLAIVVADMAAAWAQLSAVPGWTAISTAGPVTLPAASGGVTAFKFRDPDGHPLELLAFPAAATPATWQRSPAIGCLGIDHSAISIADTERSIDFYRRLGLRRIGGSFNCGPEQDRLDAMAGAQVEVTAVAPPQISSPHLELLCYRGEVDRKSAPPETSPPETPPSEINDVAATRLVLSVADDAILDSLCAANADAVRSGPVRFESGARGAMLRDPDGHLICLLVPR